MALALEKGIAAGWWAVWSRERQRPSCISRGVAREHGRSGLLLAFDFSDP